MASYQLADVPAATFKAFLQQLSSQEHANLRQVSTSVCKRTTQLVPHINLRLTANSTTDQLQQWCRATKQLQHVAAVHVHLDGPVPAEVFDVTMQLLSQQFKKITELYLLGVSSSSNKKILQTLQPIKHIIAKLGILVLKGFEVAQPGMPSELEQLAKAATAEAKLKGHPWQLQSLVISAEWASFKSDAHWSEFPIALRHLTEAFPCLRHFEVDFPRLNYVGLALITGPPAETTFFFDRPGQPFNSYWQAQLVQVALVTAVVNAVQQLKCLETLSMNGISNIWVADKPHPTSVSAAATAAPTAPEVVEVNAILAGGLLPSLAAAAEAFKTMDDCGLWLLQHHHTLTYMHIRTVSSYRCGFSMSWQQQQQQQQQIRQGTGCAHGGAEYIISADWSLAHGGLELARPWHRVVWSSSGIYNGDDNSSSRCYAPLADAFSRQLSQYSSRPVLSIMHNISSCELSLLQHADVDGLAELLGDLKSLKHLEVSLPDYPKSRDAIPGTDKVIAAAAAGVSGLQSLTISSVGFRLHADLLLPLTAAAGGPGSSLKKLKLSGSFETVIENHSTKQCQPWTEATTTADAAGACASSKKADSRVDSASTKQACLHHSADEFAALSIDQTTKDGNRVGITKEPPAPRRPNPFAALQQLSGLREFIIINCRWPKGGTEKAPPLPLYVDLLPATLVILEAEGVKAVLGDPNDSCSSGAAAVLGAAPAATVQAISSGTGTINVNTVLDTHMHQRTAGKHFINLQRLYLRSCFLDNPSVFASDQLHELEVMKTSWSGGWAAASAAWPNVRKLTWTPAERILQPEHDHSNYKGSHSSSSSSSNNNDGETNSDIDNSEYSLVTASDAGFIPTSEQSVDETVPKALEGSDPKTSDQLAGVDLLQQACADISLGFEDIKVSTLPGLPWLFADVLQPVVEHMLQEVKVMPWPPRPNVRHKAVQQWLQQQLPRARVYVR